MERFNRKFHLGESRCWVAFEHGASFETLFFSAKIRDSCVLHEDVSSSQSDIRSSKIL